MPNTAPEWLLVMRALTGMVETPGAADNPKILAMRTEIARRYPEMASYCAQYQHDSTPWCGLTAAYCLAMSGIRPPFGDTDTERFLWARSFADDPDLERITAPRLGCIVVLTRSGGGHVTYYERTSGSNYICRGGNQGDAVNESSYPKSNVIALVWPRSAPVPPVTPIPPDEKPMLDKGDSGLAVRSLQKSLGIPADGDFGAITESQVKAFQAASNLAADGIVGSATWAEVDKLDARMKAGDDGLPPKLIESITQIAKESEIAGFSWPDRGRPPPGYIPGMALVFALAVKWHNDNDAGAVLMAQAASNNAETDALAFLANEFASVGMSNAQDGLDTLRHLFVLMIGLGMRESSGKYCEGRDMSATNVTAETCEAGLFQTSWNIRTASIEIPKLMTAYWADPNGFLEQFNDGINPSANNLQVYGSGDGARYQFLAKFSPAFAAMVTAIGLRTRRKHWGPINRNEVDLVPAADTMLRVVQSLVEKVEPAPEPTPEPTPEPAAKVSIVTTGKVVVTVNGKVIS